MDTIATVMFAATVLLSSISGILLRERKRRRLGVALLGVTVLGLAALGALHAIRMTELLTIADLPRADRLMVPVMSILVGGMSAGLAAGAVRLLGDALGPRV